MVWQDQLGTLSPLSRTQGGEVKGQLAAGACVRENFMYMCMYTYSSLPPSSLASFLHLFFTRALTHQFGVVRDQTGTYVSALHTMYPL